MNNEEELQTFMQKMKNGLQSFLKNVKMEDTSVGGQNMWEEGQDM